jgi:SET domain-containing protein
MAENDSNRKRAGGSVRASRTHGQGVFANRAFLQGEIVLEIDDSDPVLDRVRLTPEQEIFIDVFVALDGTQKTAWMKSPEKFINHSCDPTSYVLTDSVRGVRRTLALKDLQSGDELTWDYAVNIWEEWVAPVSCHCGAENCRGAIQGNYFTLPREIQRRYLPLLDVPFKKRFSKEILSLGLVVGHDPV